MNEAIPRTGAAGRNAARRDNAEVEQVTVSYSIAGSDKSYSAPCAIIAGYTTRDDIPKMIAIKRGVDVDAVIVHEIS